MSESPQPWLSYRRHCPQTLQHQYTTTPPLTPATLSFLPCDKRTNWPPWTKRPITHQHRANATKVSSRLTDKDSQPPVYQVGFWAKGCIYFRGLYGPRWGTCHPYLNTPGHQATRPSGHSSANELGGLRFAGVGPKWSTIQPRSTSATPLWQPRALGI